MRPCWCSATSPRSEGPPSAALGFAAAITAGFVGVFSVFGLLLASVAGQIQERLPWFTVILGLVLVALGGWLAAGRTLPGPRISTGQGQPVTRSFTSMVLFGMGIVVAIVSLAVAHAKGTVVSALRRAGRLVSRLGGLLLLATGAYVA